MFKGQVATTPQQALRLMAQTEKTRFQTVETTLNVLEKHHRINGHTAIIGSGMGGSLAFEAAINRSDVEAAVAYGGFPQRYWNQFQRCQTPILAIYGSEEPYIKAQEIAQLKSIFKNAVRAKDHHVEIIEGSSHTFFSENPSQELREQGKQVINLTLAFLERYIERPDMSEYAQY
jgi:dienelactone hydrolase